MDREKMNIVIAGHVDHGKSTIIGRLLADTGSLPKGKLDQVKASCEKNSKPFEYAFLIDALKDEQAQGITIDSARVFFKTLKRDYIIIDAPGHIEFLKNMVTGASHAEAALLVIDALEGIKENSRRHGYMLSMLGISRIVVLINKMDLVYYSESVYRKIVDDYLYFLAEIAIEPVCFIPVSGFNGDNIVALSDEMPWHKKCTVLDILDALEKEADLTDKPFRMPVQGIYKFTKYGDSRRIIAGTVLSGRVKAGDKVIFYPSGKKSEIQTIESFNTDTITEVQAGYAIGFTLSEQIYIVRGELAAKDGECQPKVTSKLHVNLFWLGKVPMTSKKEYILKLGMAKVPAKIESIIRVIDASNLNSLEHKDRIERFAVAECVLKLKNTIAFDEVADIAAISRFVIVDNYEITGGGIIREALQDNESEIRKNVFLRNYKWEKSIISAEKRAERYNQKSALIIITGEKNTGKKIIAKNLEATLFNEGKHVYFLGIGNILYGVDADLKKYNNNADRKEHIRRLSEVVHLMLDAGIILIISAVELTQNDLEIIKTGISPDKIETIWLGENITTDISYDLHLENGKAVDDAVNRIKELLWNNGIIFKPW